MPGALGETDVLRHGAVARHHDMRGHAQRAHFGEIRVHLRRQGIGEQPVDPGTAEFPGRQTDAMDDDQFRLHPRRARVMVRRQDLSDTAHPSAVEVDLQVHVL